MSQSLGSAASCRASMSPSEVLRKIVALDPSQALSMAPCASTMDIDVVIAAGRDLGAVQRLAQLLPGGERYMGFGPAIASRCSMSSILRAIGT